MDKYTEDISFLKDTPIGTTMYVVASDRQGAIHPFEMKYNGFTEETVYRDYQDYNTKHIEWWEPQYTVAQK